MKPIRVAAAVLEHEGRFLITKRFKTSHLGHCWEFPGGKIEAGESPEDCIVRECAEEIGIQIRPLRIIEEIAHAYPEIAVHLIFIRCLWVSGDPCPIACEEIRWVKPEELGDYDFPAADRALIERLGVAPESL